MAAKGSGSLVAFEKEGLPMKRLAVLLLVIALTASLTACGNSTNSSTPVSSSQPAASSQRETSLPASQNAEDSEPVDDSSGKSESNILIAYFTAAENSGVDAIASTSYTTIGGSAVGRVRALADMIEAETGGELFSIQTQTVYPADGGELIDFAAEEQDQNVRPELTSHIENLEQYDTIFIGYPNWWYDMPMALYSFFEEYNFSGKTIIPFNTHNGSRFSNTIQTIEQLEPNATVMEDGFTVSEQNVADADEDVAAWLDGLGY